MSYYIKNPPGEHTAAYNVDVANCDRRRRESKAFAYEIQLHSIQENEESVY